MVITFQGDEHAPVGDWSTEVVEEERRQSGYLTDSVLSGRGRGYRKGRGRGRGMGGASSSRDSGEWCADSFHVVKSSDCMMECVGYSLAHKGLGSCVINLFQMKVHNHSLGFIEECF